MPATQRKKAYEEIADSIRSQVLSGELEQDQRLPPEREFAEHFGVSRVVLREAIRTLELSGILRVQKGAGGGTFVCRDLDKPLITSIQNLLAGGDITLEHLFEMRLMLEPPAAAQAARRADTAGLTRLNQVLNQALETSHDPVALRANNLEFHRCLVSLAGNPLLSALVETVISILVQGLKGKPSMETSLTVMEFHKKITQAVAQGQAERARSLTVEDLETLRNLYQQLGIEVSQDRRKPQAGQRI